MITNSIAPAANESNIGKIIFIYKTSITPIMADIGSTIPDKVPIKKDFFLDSPSFLKGIDIAAPSGIFCSPIPIAKDIAAINVAPSIL